MTETIEDITETFCCLLDNWEDRYHYIIELGQKLVPYPEAARDNAHKVPGCTSQVWLLCQCIEERNDPVIIFKADSDAYIVKGLIYIVLALFSGKRSSDILRTDAESILSKLGLDQHLTSQRSNGLKSIIKRIREEASRRLIIQ